MPTIQRQGPMEYRNYRYLKVACLLAAGAVSAYLIEPVGSEPYGGSWQGYALGIVSALIVLLQMWYGIARRRTSRVPNRRHQRGDGRERAESPGRPEGGASRAGDIWYYGRTLQGWLSSHVYLGTSLIVLATLHTGFQFGWNVHTLSYVLMLLVIASGFYGMYVYMNYPRLITLNMGEDTLDDVLLKIAELDELARVRALGLPDDINALVLRARQETRLGGNLWQQLSGRQRNCPTMAAVRQVLQLGAKYINDEQPRLMRDLYSVLLRKEKLVLRARNEIMLNARLQFWLYLHAPLSVALLSALVAHVVAILFYW